MSNQGDEGGLPPLTQQTLYRGVVIDIIHDPAVLDEEQYEELTSLVKEPALVGIAPRNTCIVQIVTGGIALREDEQYTVCFPFFPPHLGMPVKPGEHVWVFVEDQALGASSPMGYWICRVSEPLHIDDINYTHSDRAYGAVSVSPDDVESDPPESEDRGLGFPNGLNTPDNSRLKDLNKFEQIYSGSLGMQSVTLEPVPRFTKRPGDLVLQGSNNTSITLG
jgi:hypothetical protein